MENEIIEQEEIDEEISMLAETNVEEPSFPIFVFMMAIAKDIIDFISLGFLGWLSGLFFGFIIFIWVLNKSGFLQRKILRIIIRRIWLLLIDLIPFISAFFPGAIIFVLLVHNREKKIVQFTLTAIEQYLGHGKIKL